MENNPLRGLFGVSSPRPEPQLATPQPTAPTVNIEYEIPSGMIEQLLANPYAGDGTEHPDMHLMMFSLCLLLVVMIMIGKIMILLIILKSFWHQLGKL